MADKHDESEKYSPQPRGSSERRVMQCAACSQMTGYSASHPYCAMCGAKLELSTPNYSGRVDDIVTGRDRFPIRRRGPIVERRRDNRIPCRDARACIRTGTAGSLIVDVPNISRNGACFRSFEQFSAEATISIATHYIEGGQNIFQSARIIWTQVRAADMPIEYGVEFSRTQIA